LLLLNPIILLPLELLLALLPLELLHRPELLLGYSMLIDSGKPRPEFSELPFELLMNRPEF
jgi:hypothetical protein